MNPENPEKILAVVLAGGESSRFAKTVEGEHPPDKLLAELIEGKTAVDITLENLKKFGVPRNRLIIVTSPSKHSLFQEKYRDYSVILQPDPKGNADAAAKAIPEIKSIGEDSIVILVQGDDSFTYDETDYRKLIDNLIKHNADVAVMTLDPNRQWDEKTKSFWQVAIDENGIVQSVTKEGLESTQALVNAFAIRAGVFVNYMDRLEPNPLEKNEKILPDFMRKVLENGGKIVVVPTEKFLGFNDFSQFMQARAFIQSNL